MSAEPLMQLLDKHLYLHGIQVERDLDNKPLNVSLRGVKQGLVNEQKELLAAFRNTDNVPEKRNLEKKIIRLNRRLMLVRERADCYQEFVNFALGDIPAVSATNRVTLL